MGLGDDAAAHRLVQRADGRRRDQLCRVIFGQPAETQLRQPLELARGVPVALGKNDDDRLRVKASRDEGEHLGRGAIQPLGVIDEADHRPRLGVLGELAQKGQPHEEAIGRALRAESECCLQCLSLRWRQALQAVEERLGELMDRGERQLHLRLDADRPEYLTALAARTAR